MVLYGTLYGRVGRCRISLKDLWKQRSFCFYMKGGRTRFARKPLNDRAEWRDTRIRPPYSRAAEGGERHQA